MATKVKANRAESTFWWEITLDPNHPTTRVSVLTGYSHLGGNEHQHPDILLMNKIKNPFSNYFDRMLSIVVYRNDAQVPKTEHEPVLVMTPYGWHSEDMWIHNRPFLVNYLNSIYQGGKVSQKQANKVDKMQKRIPIEVFRQELHHKMRFKSHEELLAFCDEKKSRFGKPAVEGWYQIHVHDFQPELLEKAQPMRVAASAFKAQETVVDHEQHKALQQGIQQLTKKFNART